MENKKHNISVGENLYKDLKEYCELNSLKLNEFAESLLKNALMIEKYGDAPFFTAPKNEVINNLTNGPINEPINPVIVGELNVEPIQPIIKDEHVTLVSPIEMDKPDSIGCIFPKEVVEKAVDKFNEEHNLPTPEKIGEITHEILKEKPKRKVTKLK